MLIELYDTHSILECEVRRKLLDWYLRFDLTGSIMSGNETTASRDWFSAISNYFSLLVSRWPHSIDYKIEHTIWEHRCNCVDMNILFAKYSKALITQDEFRTSCSRYASMIETWHKNLDAEFFDERYRVWSFGTLVRWLRYMGNSFES